MYDEKTERITTRCFPICWPAFQPGCCPSYPCISPSNHRRSVVTCDHGKDDKCMRDCRLVLCTLQDGKEYHAPHRAMNFCLPGVSGAHGWSPWTLVFRCIQMYAGWLHACCKPADNRTLPCTIALLVVVVLMVGAHWPRCSVLDISIHPNKLALDS
jgi:hypothetical protein